VLQGRDDPNRFLLYECYQSPEGFAAHQQTPHYQRWKQAVAEWMAQPRQGVHHHSLFFGDAEG
jgi:autoinducer 2-degrading protein